MSSGDGLDEPILLARSLGPRPVLLNRERAPWPTLRRTPRPTSMFLLCSSGVDSVAAHG